MRRLGQHFLTNQKAIHAIIASLAPERGQAIIEIGPGHGELTLPLLHALPRDTHVVAVERDPALLRSLREAARGYDYFEVIEGDALRIIPVLAGSTDQRFQSYVIVGNLPYYITGFLLRILSDLPHKPTRAVFTIQKEVASRIIATPPRMNRLAASVQVWATPRVLMTFPPESFSPSPRVHSAVISLTTRTPSLLPTHEAEDAYYRLVRTLFQHPRKTILNNLLDDLSLTRDVFEARLRSLGVSPALRPHDLSLPLLLQLSSLLFARK